MYLMSCNKVCFLKMLQIFCHFYALQPHVDINEDIMGSLRLHRGGLFIVGRVSRVYKRLRLPRQIIKGRRYAGKCGPVCSLLLPAVKHELIEGLGTVHWGRQPIALFDTLDHILIGPVPVRPFAVRHHFPQHDTVRPHVGGGCEFSECYGFWGRPANRYFTTLANFK